MNNHDTAVKKNRRFLRDVTAGVVGLLAAIALVLVTLWFQDYMTTSFLSFALFIFPVPVGCGLAVGLISPKRAIVWAPLWAAISTALLFALVSGGVHNASLSLAPLRVVSMLIGVVLAGAAGLAGQFARKRSYVVRSVLTFLFLCMLMGLGQHFYVCYRTQAFEQAHADEINLQVDRDYIALPRGLNWECRRRPTLECYELSTRLNGSRLSVLVSPVDSEVMGVTYNCKGKKHDISDSGSARLYLLSHGFRQPLLSGLVQNKKQNKGWTSGFNGTSLHLSTTGFVTLAPIYNR